MPRDSAPTIPFWLGEAPARTEELSAAVSRLRARSTMRCRTSPPKRCTNAWRSCAKRMQLGGTAAQQLVDYLATAKATLGRLPTRELLVIERFFDEAGGMQLVIHAPFGARVNRALGLALRKRFCQTFNFELQAAATEDAIVLSLGETHSFALEEVAQYLHSNTVEDVLTQAVLDAPLFMTRWRWNATISLAIKTSRGGKKTPPPLLRMAAEDLVSVLFPDQLACQENLSGPREIPDHPLVRQTLHDCLHEAMDIDGLVALLRGIESGEVQVLTRDLPHPSHAGDGDPEARGPMPTWTMRRWRNAARRPWPRGAGSIRRAPRSSAGSIPRPSRSCARKPGRIRKPPTSCTMR